MYPLLLPLLVSNAHATCGLDHCPMPETTQSPASMMLGVSSSRATVMQADSAEIAIGGTWTLHEAVQFGAWMPVVAADNEGTWLRGTGNPLAFAAWNSNLEHNIGWGAGLQAELPFASEPELGDSHWMLLPYAKFWAEADLSGAPFKLIAHVGWAKALEGEDDHHGHHGHDDHHHGSEGHTSALIWPHTDNEVQARAELILPVRTHFSGGLRLDAVHEITEKRTLLMSGIVGIYSRQNFSTQIAITAPVTDAQRLDYRATWQLSYNLAVPQ